MPMNRWKMHKLGFLNFWLYDQEEFLIQNGHILLRGDNASGKSITTQSFIPFILLIPHYTMNIGECQGVYKVSCSLADYETIGHRM